MRYQIRYKNLRLFAVSFVMFFLEVLLIRLVSTEIRFFAYVSNLVLLACFLGIGAGCYLSKKRTNINITLAALALISLAIRFEPFRNITSALSGFSDSVIWHESLKPFILIPALVGMFFAILLFMMIAVVFVPLGQMLGRLLDEQKNIIKAYSINIAASLAGIWAFNACSFFYAPPWVWFLLSLTILAPLVPKTGLNIPIAVFFSALILLSSNIAGSRAGAGFVCWSPYQKLDLRRNVYEDIDNGYIINVNNVGYMVMLDLSDRFIKEHDSQYKTAGEKKYSQYELPYRFAGNKDTCLIVGAGGGNDVAGALRNDIKYIDAVEIDPAIYGLGHSMHPERPYDSDKVHITIDDARAFFKRCDKKYDIICFGLLDSHTLSSSYNNMRLDHYVYTEESFRDVKSLLKGSGVVSVIFEVQRKWIGDRIYGLLKKVFGEVPYAFTIRPPGGSYGWGGVIFITGNDTAAIKARVESDPALKDFINKHSVRDTYDGTTRLSTDNWPYLYIKEPCIPRMYILVIACVTALLFVAKKSMERFGGHGLNMHFFFLGSAFLLLEFQNISKSALLFGATWVTNSYIISSILLLALLANFFVYWFKIRNIGMFYLLLLTSIIIVYLVPLDIFNVFGYWAKLGLAATFINVPIFFAGVIFIVSFKNAPAKDIALGSNIIGGVMGGILETLSLLTGIRALLIVVFLLYAMSFFCLKPDRLHS